MKLTELLVSAGKSYSPSVRNQYAVICAIKRINDLSKDVFYPIISTKKFGIVRKLHALVSASGADNDVLFALLPRKEGSSIIEPTEAIRVLIILNKIDMEGLLKEASAQVTKQLSPSMKLNADSALWLFKVMAELLDLISKETERVIEYADNGKPRHHQRNSQSNCS